VDIRKMVVTIRNLTGKATEVIGEAVVVNDNVAPAEDETGKWYEGQRKNS
jgi:hypothetical protein